MGIMFDQGVRKRGPILIWGYAERYNFDLGVRKYQKVENPCPKVIGGFDDLDVLKIVNLGCFPQPVTILSRFEVLLLIPLILSTTPLNRLLNLQDNCKVSYFEKRNLV